jgi:hypothetical protein
MKAPAKVSSITRMVPKGSHRLHLVNPAGRSCGVLKFYDDKPTWLTGPIHQGDAMTAQDAYAAEAAWTEYFKSKGTGYRALAWPIALE